MIVRNIDVQQGVVNGTTGILESVHSRVLILCTLDGLDAIPVPRVKQKMIHPSNGITCYRIQNPIILSWAVTAHRCQRITVKKGCNAYAYLDSSFFADGQGYVCLSRVETFEQIHLLSFDPTAIFASSAVRKIVDTAKQTKLIMTKSEKRNIFRYTTIDKSNIDIDTNTKTQNLRMSHQSSVCHMRDKFYWQRK